jgi:hypothetical protein
MAKAQLKPDVNGNLLIPREVLGDVTEGIIYHVEREGRTIRLEPAQQKLHEIENPQERAEAAKQFLKRIAYKTGVRWPEDYNIRDDIYD